MAKNPCKGTVLQVRISGVYTAVSQIISLDLAETKPETFDATALDSGAAKENAITGFVSHGDLSGDLFLDPALSVHRFLFSIKTAPPAAGTDCKIILTDAGAREVTGTIIAFGMGMAVDMADGLKSSFSATPKAGWTFPSS